MPPITTLVSTTRQPGTSDTNTDADGVAKHGYMAFLPLVTGMSTHVCGISGTYRIWVMPGRWPLVLPMRSCLSLGPRATHMPQSVLLLMVLIVVKVIWFPLEMNRTDKWPHSLLR